MLTSHIASCWYAPYRRTRVSLNHVVVSRGMNESKISGEHLKVIKPNGSERAVSKQYRAAGAE